MSNFCRTTRDKQFSIRAAQTFGGVEVNNPAQGADGVTIIFAPLSEHVGRPHVEIESHPNPDGSHVVTVSLKRHMARVAAILIALGWGIGSTRLFAQEYTVPPAGVTFMPLIVYEIKDYNVEILTVGAEACLRGPLTIKHSNGDLAFALEAGAEYPAGCGTRPITPLNPDTPLSERIMER